MERVNYSRSDCHLPQETTSLYDEKKIEILLRKVMPHLKGALHSLALGCPASKSQEGGHLEKSECL